MCHGVAILRSTTPAYVERYDVPSETSRDCRIYIAHILQLIIRSEAGPTRGCRAFLHGRSMLENAMRRSFTLVLTEPQQTVNICILLLNEC